jgi:hypothetical protein
MRAGGKMKYFVIGVLLSLSISSIASAGKVKSVVSECDLGAAYSTYEMDRLIEEGYKLISVIQLDNPPSARPEFRLRKCSYIFSQQ